MLSNENYTGHVRLLKTGKSAVYYLATDNIERSFWRSQIEKKQRNNIVKNEDGWQRKDNKYSSKK